MSEDPIIAALARLEVGQAKLEAGLGKLEVGVAKLEEGVAKLEVGQAKLEVSVANLEVGQGKLEEGLAKLEGRQTKLEEGQTKLRTDFLAELGGTRAAIMDRIDRLQNRFDEMRADVNANFNNAARIDDKGLSTQNEVRAMVEQYNHLYRRMQTMDARLRSLEDGKPTPP